jgi:hypothetical protein
MYATGRCKVDVRRAQRLGLAFTFGISAEGLPSLATGGLVVLALSPLRGDHHDYCCAPSGGLREMLPAVFRSCRTSPQLAAQMFTSYRKVRLLHELMVLLELAMIRVPPENAAPLALCLYDIQNICASEQDLIQSFNEGAMRERVLKLLRVHLRGDL